mgnify:CR=1 FL=1
MSELEFEAADILVDVREPWDEFVDEWQPIENPENPGSYYFYSDSNFLSQVPSGSVWLIYQPWGQDQSQFSFAMPTLPDDFSDLGKDGEGYIVTKKTFDEHFVNNWRESQYASMQVRLVLGCSVCNGESDECEHCEGVSPVTISLLDEA